MANGIRTGDTRGFNKGRSSKFRESSRVRQTPEEGRRTYRPKHSGNNNKDENNSPKPLMIKIQNQIDKIREYVEDRQSRIAWQKIHEVSRRNSTTKAKLKATKQHERIKLSKQHFQNL